MRNLFGILFLLFVTHVLNAQSFDLNENCKLAFEDVLSLRIEHGLKLLELEKQSHPENLMPLVIENYADFLQVFITEEQKELDKLNFHKKDRIEAIESVKDVTAYKKWALATIYLQSAFARIKFDENYSAALEFRKAFLLLDENQKDFPNFRPNQLSLGLLYALIGSIPAQYQWVVKLASMNGSIDQGRTLLNAILDESETFEKNNYLRSEALFFLSFIELNLVPDTEAAEKLLQRFKPQDRENLLLVYAKTNLEMRLGNNEAAIKTLKSRPETDAYFPFYYLDYLYGDALLRKQEYVASLKSFKVFLKEFHGKNYQVDAMRKTAWIALLNGDTAKYKQTMQTVMLMKPGDVESDQQAQREAKGEVLPPAGLLKARLLFDGGYYIQAKSLLLQLYPQLEGFSEAEKLEFHYRFGRIEQALGNNEQALEYYHWTYTNGSQSPLYYPANAALKAAEYNETNGNYNDAIVLYEKCLSLKPEEYKQGIHIKAKNGLNRIKEEGK